MIHSKSYLRQWLLFFALLIAAQTFGCGGGDKGKIWVYHYPEFYNPELKRVAVLPFANRSSDPTAGQRIGGKVSALLTNNGTYEVYTRENLSDILAEKDMLDAGIIEADKAIEIGKLKAVQALICGSCDRYDVQTVQEIRYNTVPQYGYDAYGNTVITGWINVPYQWMQHNAAVECQVVVIDTKTGRQMGAVADPSAISDDGSPPDYQPADLIRMAEEDQIKRILRGIAVTKTRIKLEGRVIRTATGLYDNEWDWKDAFTANDDKVTLVVTLPGEADRNSFRVRIIKKDARETLAEKSFEWNKVSASVGHDFEIAPILEKGGEGQYEAKLYSGPEPIAWYTFSISKGR